MAGPYISSDVNNYVGIGKQSSRGSSVVPTTFIAYTDSAGFDHGMDAEDVHEAGVGPYVSRSQKAKHDPAGSFAFAARPQTTATLAAYTLGADTATGTTNAYTHTATPSLTTTYLSIERNLADEAIERVVDSVIKKLAFSGEGGRDLAVSCDWIGCSPWWASSATSETYESGISGSTPGGPYRMNEASYTIDTAAATNVFSWSVELEWKLDEDIRLSAITRSYVLKLELAGSISVKQLMLNTTDYRTDNYQNASGTNANKNFHSGDFSVAFNNGLAGTNLRTLTIAAPNVDWRTTSYTELNPNGETTYLERQGTIRKASGADFARVVSLTADTAAYV